MQNLWSLEYKNTKIEKNEQKDFFQSKYNYYKEFSFWIVTLAFLSSAAYFISDCQIFGRLQFDTFIPRLTVLIIWPFYFIAHKKIVNYRLMSAINNVCLHLVMINTTWAIYYLPDKSHVDEGFLIMQCMFLAMSFSVPFSHTVITFVAFYLVDILISNTFNNYEDLEYILSLGFPLTLGIIGAAFALQRLYVGHYKIEKELEISSTTDFLTGIKNRNYLFNYIENIEHTKKEDSCVFLYDIDYFKSVNDTYGHDAGDEILCEVANISKKCLRKQDVVARWGGEEFVIFLPNTPLTEAEKIAERLRRAVEESDTGICSITISVGVSPFIDNDLEKSVALADKALYDAKEAGRNTVKTAVVNKNKLDTNMD